MKAIIVCNGDFDLDLFNSLDSDIIICADGGANHLLKNNIKPNHVIGDLDSINAAAKKKFKDILILDKNTNTTDSEKAVLFAKEKGCTEIIMLAATGCRIDHNLTNINLLAKYSNLNMTLVDSANKISFVKSKTELKCNVGDIISLIPLGKVKGLELSGLKYTPKNNILDSVGVHNVAVSNKIKISYTKGNLLIDKLTMNNEFRTSKH